MTDILKIDPQHDSTNQMGMVAGAKAHIPLTFPTEQAYYWRLYWQNAEAEALNEIEAGEFMLFDSDDPHDAARWLLGDD